jgi:uncharacterized protein (TIGR03032 family)
MRPQRRTQRAPCCRCAASTPAALLQLLDQGQLSLLISTYQAGKLVIARADGDAVNTHFRMFDKPMGMVADLNRLYLGTRNGILLFRNMPALGRRTEPKDRCDAVYVPRQKHFTGDIDIHEMALDSRGKLWAVNTRFSCLCTFDVDHSFSPRWRPKFVSAYAPEDRCHLNGLAMKEGLPTWVTALGTADTAGGWRENKAAGGVIVDVPSNEIVAHGLSMPHSPRWYDGRWWVLESGKGSLATVDPANGQITTVCELPGFTRGLDFYGRYALVGLSQVRETATFSGIPITERSGERNCGVWVVDIVTGEIAALLRFEDAVQEIFSVQTLPGLRFAEVLEPDHPLVLSAYVLPDQALREVPQALRA